jgi:hypothetical protein
MGHRAGWRRCPGAEWASRFGPEEQHTEERLDSAGVRARLAGYTYATIRTRLRRS